MYDVVIIGSGSAGLAAAIYARRAGLKAVTIERNPISGGQVLNTYEVDNYPGLSGISGFDMGVKFREHADKLGCEFMETEVLKIEAEEAGEEGELQAAEKHGKREGYRLTTDQGQLEARTVIAAMGASHAKLGIPGEEELCGMGVSYCATCDGAFFKGRTAAVVGGGDVAVEDAIFLSRVCKKVYLIHRRDALRAAALLQEELLALPNVEVLWNTVAEKINGEEQVESLLLKNVKDNSQKELAVDGVFVAVGIHPASELVRGLADCDEGGYILAGEDCRTSVPGMFAAGDVRKKKLRQVVTAVADGANAVASVLEYLEA